MTPHVVPHAPQLLGSVSSFTQLPLHAVCPAAHAQAPFWHVSALEHFVLQPPQWPGSVSSFTHAPLQSVSLPAGHAQLPPWQL